MSRLQEIFLFSIAFGGMALAIMIVLLAAGLFR